MVEIHDTKSIMNSYSNIINYLAYIILAVFAFYINYFFSNIGVYPIDTFSFFDSGYLITKGYHPVKDFWIISGILVDYIQALFFTIFGNNWNAYIFHSSMLNAFVGVFFLFFLNNFQNNLYFNLLVSICFVTLCYPVAGTPFPYQHSFILSLTTILIFYLAVYKENKKYWFILPFFMFASFLSMQLPAGLINLLILIFTFIYFLKSNLNFVFYFIAGILLSCIILIFYFFYVNVDIKDFIIQIILFPLSIGEGRILNDENAYESAKLINRLTFRGIFGHFKFIILFISFNIISLIFFLKKNKNISFKKEIFLNLFIIFCSLSFIFHQLITANQTFIFSLIPFLCGFFLIQLNDLHNLKNKKIKIFLLLLILFVTIKYHNEYNTNRKFMDLQNINLNNAIEAKDLNSKFNGLRWITPFYFSKDPKKELQLLKQASLIISNENENEIVVITHYQFFSTLSQKKIRIFNRWYFPGNNTHPSTNKNKFYSHYIDKLNNQIIDNDIKKIFLVKSHPKEFNFIKFEDILKNLCYEKKIYNEIFLSINIKKCSNQK